MPIRPTRLVLSLLSIGPNQSDQPSAAYKTHFRIVVNNLIHHPNKDSGNTGSLHHNSALSDTMDIAYVTNANIYMGKRDLIIATRAWGYTKNIYTT